MAKKKIDNYADFWPFYMGEHAKPATRLFHVLGTSIGFGLLIAAVVYRNPWYVLAALLSGYAFAWVSHFFIEKNRPATFTYPLWSFVSDWKLWAMTLTGQMDKELRRLGLKPREED